MASAAAKVAPHPRQELRFCRAPDGTRLAYAKHGAGPPLVVATCWLSHLQHDWQSPVWRHFLADLGEIATVCRYDERGYGLSDWDVDDFSLEARVTDLEAIVDDAGLERFGLLAMAQGGPVAITYAARHPERVSRLIFYASFASLFLNETAEEQEIEEAFERLIKVGWERPTREFRRVFTWLMIPGASEEQMRWIDDLQRMATSADNRVRSRREYRRAAAVDLLGSVSAPTLVIHGRDDHMIPFAAGRFLASNIAGARLVALESENHIVLGDDPAWPVLLREVTDFVAPDREVGPDRGPLATLSTRENHVLRLVATGEDNEAIAASLFISVRTVERHLQNAYTKLGVQGKSARAAAAALVSTR